MNPSSDPEAFPKWMKAVALVFIIAVFLLSPNATEAKLSRFTLSNGLKVLIRDDPARKVTAIQLWVMVGGSDEEGKELGISHLIEHMAFKGTQRRGVGAIAAELEALGGYVNAFTSRDETVFHVTVPSNATAQGLDILMDAVLYPAIDPGELEKEKKVVIEEILERDERPEVKLHDFLYMHAYERHPYRYPIIGYKEGVEKFTREDILAFRNKWYVAENMFLVIAGDVDAEKLRPEIERLAKDLPAVPVFRAPKPVEPDQKELRSAILRDRSARETRLALAFHIPSMKDADVNALDLAGSILGSRESSRLVRILKKEKRLVNEISAHALTPKDPGVFSVSARLDAKNLEAAIKAIMQEIQRLGKEPPTGEELQRAKTEMEAEHTYSRETVDGMAQSLGNYEAAVGYAEYAEKYLMLNAAVAKEQISAVVRKYLAPPNVTIAVLLPEEQGKDLNPDRLTKVVNSFAVSEAIGKSEADKAKVVTRTLPNGIQVILMPDRSNPVISFRIASLGGKRFETKETEGIFNYISQMLTKGTKASNELDISRKIEDMGGRLAGFSGNDSFGLGASFFSKYLDEGLRLLADIYTNASFPEDKMERERALIINRIKTQPDRPIPFAVKSMNEVLFQQHPYGFDKDGTLATVGAFKRDDLVRVYRRYVVPANTVITGVGDMDTDKTLQQITQLFGSIEKRPMEAPKIHPEGPLTDVREKTIKIPRAKSHLVVGFRASTLKDEDRFPLAVLNNVLANQGGRLFQQLRDKESLAYIVSAFFRPGIDPGAFGFYISTDTAKMDQVVGSLFREIGRIRDEPVGQDELTRAKNNLMGYHQISLQSSSSRAENTVLNTLYGLGYDYDKEYIRRISQVTADQVQRVAKQYLNPERCVIVKILPDDDAAQATDKG